jgi:hypothetical protein
MGLSSLHRGHFFASGESSGTSTISLMQINQELRTDKLKGTCVIYSPAKRYLFRILTSFFASSC